MNMLENKHQGEDSPIIFKKGILLAAAFVLIVAAGMRWNVSIAGWLYPIPLLLYIRLGYPFKSLFWVMSAAFILQVMKIASEPLYAAIALGAGLQASIFMALILHLTKKMGERIKNKSYVYTPVVFASLMTLFEFGAAKLSIFGVWGMAANTQLENLPLLQLASLTGAYGISFLIMWTAALSEGLLFRIASGAAFEGAFKKGGAILAALLFAAYAFGGIRLDQMNKGPTVHVAGVSAKGHGIVEVMQSEEARLANNAEVYELLEKAATQRVELVVSNEGALFIKPAEEETMRQTLSELARRRHVAMAIGYVVYRGADQKFLNQMIILDANGDVLQKYDKQFIPPGEPAEHRESQIRSVDLLLGGAPAKISGAICYDFDSIDLTKEHGKSGSGLALLPSSDWRGIDPIHTQMARLRAIEQGYSVARSSRSSTSEFYDPYGRVRGSLAWHEENNGILTAQLPLTPISTIYKKAGDWFAYLNIIFLAVTFLRAARKDREPSVRG